MEGHAAYTRTLPAGSPAQREYRDTVPKVSYKFSDSLSATLGANVFGCDVGDTTSIGQYDKLESEGGLIFQSALKQTYFVFIGGKQPQPHETFVSLLISVFFSSGCPFVSFLTSFVIVLTSFLF